MNAKNKQPVLDVELANFCELMARYQQLDRAPSATEIKRARARARREGNAIFDRFMEAEKATHAENQRLIARIGRSAAAARR